MQTSQTFIPTFFDYYSFSQARTMLHQLIKTADSDNTWPGTHPCDVIYLQENLDNLVESVFCIVSYFNYQPEAILNKNSEIWELTKPNTYCGSGRYSPFEYFPRYLTKKEFIDPYRALEKFTRYQNQYQWKAITKQLAFNALSPTTLDEFSNNVRLLKIYIHLNKLIEACHLVHIRTAGKKQSPTNI